MTLLDGAVILSPAGIDMYAFGLFCAIGAAAAAMAMAAVCKGYETGKGSAAVLVTLTLICGILCSRIGFCLMNQSLGRMMPLDAWFRITEGGWSLSGMIYGALLGSRIAARVLKVPANRMTDAAAVGLPLMTAAVKYAESKIPDFDISRPLGDGFPSKIGFLTVRDEYGVYLATWRIGIALALILFLVLTFSMLRKNRREGDLTILFLLLCGAGGILLESLRYDHFLEISFVRLQMVLYAVMLIWGAARAVKADADHRKGLRRAEWIAAALAIAVSGGVEFALDRTSMNHVLLYAIMIAALAAPVWIGIRLMNGKGTEVT